MQDISFIYILILNHCLIFCIFNVKVTSVVPVAYQINPTPVYVVQGGEAVLQCGFESKKTELEIIIS